MNWQNVAAGSIAALCGIWVLWRWLRPLFRKQGTGCSLCDECNAKPRRGRFLHIDQARPKN